MIKNPTFYCGHGVYVEIAPLTIVLYTLDGISKKNLIYMNLAMVEQLPRLVRKGIEELTNGEKV